MSEKADEGAFQARSRDDTEAALRKTIADLEHENAALRKQVDRQEQAIMEMAIEHDSEMQEARRNPPPIHAHGSDPWNDGCPECQRESYVFEREIRENDERKYKAEIERLQDAWFQDEGIAPDGHLRTMVSRTVKRAAAMEALMLHVHRLTDPNAPRRYDGAE